MCSRVNFIHVRVKDAVAFISYDYEELHNPRISCSVQSLEENLLEILRNSKGRKIPYVTCKSCDFACILTPAVTALFYGLEQLTLIVSKKATCASLVFPELSSIKSAFKLNIEMRNPSVAVKAIVNDYIQCVEIERSYILEKNKVYKPKKLLTTIIQIKKIVEPLVKQEA
jgi:hypothetical protein